MTIGISYDPLSSKEGIILGCHVPPRKRVDLAACYRPENSVDRGKRDPPHFHRFSVQRCQPFSVVFPSRSFSRRFRCLQHINSLALIWFRLPEGHSPHGSYPAPKCFATLSDLLFIQDRRVIQRHGWSSQFFREE